MTDGELLKKAAAGDETAFVLLYQRHRDALYRFGFRMLGCGELAEDLVHDCFLALIKNSHKYDSRRAGLRTYLYAAIRNLALKHFRNYGGELSVDDLSQEPSFPSHSAPLNQLISEEISITVQKAVAQLPPLQREVLILFEYEDLSLAEISGIVGADIGTVKARLYRARKRLRRLLSPYFKGGLTATALEK